MLPQYKMVFVNIILSAFLLLSLLVYKFIFKRKINLFYLLLLISILPIVSIFRTGSYESGDLSLHTERLVSFYNLLANYHLIPRWTFEFNAGYGDPHFLFAYFLPYLIGSVFHFIGFSFLISVKLLLALSFIFSGITMYFWAKEELGKMPGFVSAIFYLFMPYHLVDMHFRVTIAENLSFVFLPLILLAIKKIIEYESKMWFIILSVSVGLLILTHQAISVMFLPIIIAYCLFTWKRMNNRKSKDLAYCILSIALGFLLTFFYWMPIISLAKFTQQGLDPSSILFPTITQLLYSPWRLGFLFQGHKGELSYLVGYTQLGVILLSIYLILRKRLNLKLRSLLLFFLIIFAALLFMVLSVSEPIWMVTPLLKYSQYSTRLLVPLALCVSIIAGIAVNKINKSWFIVMLCFLTILYTILNWGNRQAISAINDNYLIQDFKLKPDVSATLEPTSPIWADLNKSKLRIKPKSQIEIIKGNALIREIYKNPTLHSYVINAKSKIEVKENTLFFPGWIVNANGKQIPINYNHSEFPGVISFELGKGNYNVNVQFVDLPIITFSKWVSGLSFLGLLAYILIPKNLNLPKL